MTTASTAAPKIRLYLDNGKTNPEIDTSALNKYVRAMFIHWVNSNRHVRDFMEAMHHVALGLFCDYMMEGSPDLSGPEETLPAYIPPPVAAYEAPSPEPAAVPRLRFHDDEGNLTLGIDTEPYRQVLIPFMIRWIVANYHPREFVQAVCDQAASVYHDYTISCAMGGLGGCKTREEFLSSPPEL
jgi:hypothetical protein